MLSLEESGAQGDNRLEAIIIYVEQRRDHGSLLLLGLCLVPQTKHCAEKRFPVTSNLRYMHGVLNVDEIKN
jgi:hypothetical protein